MPANLLPSPGATQQGMVFDSGFWVWNKVDKSVFLSGTGNTFCPFWRWNTVGVRVTFSCQIRTANEHCCCSSSGPAACLYSNMAFPIKVNCISHSGTGYLFSPFCLEQGWQNCVSIVWNRVRFPGTQRHTPILNLGEYPPFLPGCPIRCLELPLAQSAVDW